MSDLDITTAARIIENTLAALLPPWVVTESVKKHIHRIAHEAISETTEFAETPVTAFRVAQLAAECPL